VLQKFRKKQESFQGGVTCLLPPGVVWQRRRQRGWCLVEGKQKALGRVWMMVVLREWWRPRQAWVWWKGLVVARVGGPSRDSLLLKTPEASLLFSKAFCAPSC
ncbi:hypothetical protein CUMW_275860, partial [Citrus unshiu]